MQVGVVVVMCFGRDYYSYTGRTLFIGLSSDQCYVVYKAMSDTSLLASLLCCVVI